MHGLRQHAQTSRFVSRSTLRTLRGVSACQGRRYAGTTPTEAQEKPPPAGGELPSIVTSKLLRVTRETALKSPGLMWTSEPESASPDGGRETRKMNMYQAVRDALGIALSTDESAVVFGEDVAFGGVFRCTMGLAQEYGKERVFNTPLTEQASTNGIAGFGIGLAAMGQTAIAEIQFSDYIFPAFDQLVNEAAKIRYRSGGQFNVGGLTVRTPCMSVGHGGLYHSQSPEGFFLGASGLKVIIVWPKEKGIDQMTRLSFPGHLSKLKGYSSPQFETQTHTDIGLYTPPFEDGNARTRFGSDITYLGHTPLYMRNGHVDAIIPTSIITGEDFVPRDARKANIELIDLRTILPWDMEGVIESVNRTGRLVIVHEAGRTGGVGAEIAAEVQKRCFLKLAAPVKRVCGWDTPVGLQYEKFYIPDALRILDAMVETLKY
ncbi:2-oxoisovalerate dehydrogenase subunit beta 2, mitochondrial; AltName: Full=Branched-chain alpha-keto acid dehydrogenase E1 component beta chain; Short=BCKDE1B; Short=BCKDH E1-beta; AltName: Full=Protein DARK INDUCIBLE 4; Flags: Precursor [Serendipita indica DSM 11827]|nr:2-oxoisovalerate dehydrogenase subunit beta 2, mitochondrial; AltName: Full=Branched-chain alpha-keto acid dehydrogenase E1 component beta chain; Short=BCKDE1B; Short=BCKDH E1-beta; AltName: Full=Protein DARK INDUCIBLE 4; Flags: Precursor [Serendipita indica DSM 11827]